MKRKGLYGFLILCAIVVFSGAIAFAADNSVLITGFSAGDFTFGVEDLKQLPALEKEVTSVNSKGVENKFTVTGASFADLLKKHNQSQQQLQAIRLIAGDGYSIEVPAEVLQNRTIILAYMMDGKPLDEKTRPVRVIIPEERAMYWIRNLAKIEILSVKETVAVAKVYFLETLISATTTEDYTYYDSVDKAVKVENLLVSAKLQPASTSVMLQAVDGLKKNEDSKIFREGYLKISGNDSPLFLSPDLPKGMFVKNILAFTCGDTAFFTVAHGLKSVKLTTVDDKNGMAIANFVKMTALVEGNSYRLTSLDGYSVDIAAADFMKGIIYLDDKGKVRSYFPGLPKNTSVRDLCTIEALK